MKALKLFFLSLLTAMLTYGGNYLQRGPKVVEEINPENPINSLVYLTDPHKPLNYINHLAH